MTPEDVRWKNVRHLELRLILAARDFVMENPPSIATVLHDPAIRLRATVEDLATWHGSDAHLLANLDQELCEYQQPHEHPKTSWYLRTWSDVRSGDRVRLPVHPDQPAVVSSIARNNWHVDPRASKYEARPLEWSDFSIRLEGNDSLLTFLGDAEVEIEMEDDVFNAMMLLGGWESRIS